MLGAPRQRHHQERPLSLSAPTPRTPELICLSSGEEPQDCQNPSKNETSRDDQKNKRHCYRLTALSAQRGSVPGRAGLAFLAFQLQIPDNSPQNAIADSPK